MFACHEAKYSELLILDGLMIQHFLLQINSYFI